MPTYFHKCNDNQCNNEWEDFYSMMQEPPKVCPKCNQETAKRVIVPCGKGVVELYGQELVEKLKGDAKEIQREASKDANKYASLIGEDKYQQLQTQMDRQKRR